MAKRSHKKLYLRIAVFLVMSTLIFAILCALIASYVLLSVWLHGFSFDDTYTYKIGYDSTAERRLETVTYEMGDIGDDKTLYVNFTVLQKYCGFYESGDRTVRRFIIPADRSEFTVTANSTQVEINGNLIHMEAPAILKGEALYLPLSFVKHYIGGITVENAVIETDSDENEKSDKSVDEFTYIIRCNEDGEFSLLLSDHSPCLPIDRSALD